MAEGWRRWLPALTLCVFAAAYGASSGFSEHETFMASAVACSACAHAVEPVGRGANVPLAESGPACCIAHYLPGVPLALAVASRSVVSGGHAAADESAEEWPIPVPRPPPRSDARV